jgi:hypothetical protein
MDGGLAQAELNDFVLQIGRFGANANGALPVAPRTVAFPGQPVACAPLLGPDVVLLTVKQGRVTAVSSPADTRPATRSVPAIPTGSEPD